LDEISCGYAVFGDFLPGFSVSNIPLRPPPKRYEEQPRLFCMAFPLGNASLIILQRKTNEGKENDVVKSYKARAT